MKSVPVWTWFFVVACAAIPGIALGGLIPSAIGAGGAAGCYSIGKNNAIAAGMRLALCVGVTIVCWALFVGLILLMS